MYNLQLFWQFKCTDIDARSKPLSSWFWRWTKMNLADLKVTLIAAAAAAAAAGDAVGQQKHAFFTPARHLLKMHDHDTPYIQCAKLKATKWFFAVQKSDWVIATATAATTHPFFVDGNSWFLLVCLKKTLGFIFEIRTTYILVAPSSVASTDVWMCCHNLIIFNGFSSLMMAAAAVPKGLHLRSRPKPMDLTSPPQAPTVANISHSCICVHAMNGFCLQWFVTVITYHER